MGECVFSIVSGNHAFAEGADILEGEINEQRIETRYVEYICN